MRVVLSWLREFCPVELPPEELADLLSLKGVHVEAVLRPWEGLEGVVAARVLEVRDHPNSEKLCLARVSFGAGEREVVVGVRNMHPGDVVPLAGPGARVPTLAEPLARREIRGAMSEGMLCSPQELAVSPDHGAILILPPETPVGADVKSHFGLDDAVFDIEIEPNRPDLMSVFGVAREASAATGLPLTGPELWVEESDDKAEDAATVEVRDLDRCPRYLARVIEAVAVGPSPVRVQARLTAAGMRPLSNVVDATNYAMLEIGQPLHPFDLDLLAGHAIVVRRAEEGEHLVTLDDLERILGSEDLVIADRQRAVAIAGIMGSAPAEVHAGTANVLLESAYFEPRGVIRTSRRLGLQTEASLRFGRGADPENPPRGADLAARLMVRWAGGTVLAGAATAGNAPERRRVSVRPDRATAVLGYPVSGEDVREAFTRLGIAATVGPAEVEIEVPGYRVDLEREIDLVEEVARVQGYDRLGSTLLAMAQPGELAATYRFRRRVRESMVRAGLREAISLSFQSRADLELMGHPEGVRIANPVSAEEGFLRASLVPGLVKAVRRNSATGTRSVALFEVGHVFLPGDPVDEREAVAAAFAGMAATGFHQERRPFDFFDAKGAVEALMDGLSVRDWGLGRPAGLPYHPARSAAIEAGGHPVGWLGELHPRVTEGLDLPDHVAVAEVDLSALSAFSGQPVEYREVPRFPPAHRDLAFLVDSAVPAGRVQEVLMEAAGPLLDTCVLFDVFEGVPLPKGKKNVAFSVGFRAPGRTLTDAEVDATVAHIAQQVATEVGGELRAG